MRPRLHAMRDAVQTQNAQLAALKARLDARELSYRLRLAAVREVDESQTEWVLTGRGVGGSQQGGTRTVDGGPEQRIPRTVGDRADVGGM
jgi:hypothetical protein